MTSWGRSQERLLRCVAVLRYYCTVRCHGNQKSIWWSAHCIGKVSGRIFCERLFVLYFSFMFCLYSRFLGEFEVQNDGCNRLLYQFVSVFTRSDQMSVRDPMLMSWV